MRHVAVWHLRHATTHRRVREIRMVEPLSRNAVAAVATVVREVPTPTSASLVLVVFEVLHGALVLFGGGATAERAEVTALTGSRVGFSRIQAVFARAEFANHGACFLPFPASPRTRSSTVAIDAPN